MTPGHAPGTLSVDRANGDPGCHPARSGVVKPPGPLERPMFPIRPMSYTGAAGSGNAPPAHTEA